jgi:hypothetical protein
MMKCDELKAFNMPRYAGEFTMHEVYLKSDVDSAIDELKSAHHKERHEYIKMVAELEEKLKNSRNARKYWRNEYLIEYKECLHHKYKLCLAMADKCVNLCHKAKDLYHWAEDENLEHYYNHKIEFFARWHKRWIKIAEQFKEAK